LEDPNDLGSFEEVRPPEGVAVVLAVVDPRVRSSVDQDASDIGCA
jgi:hypothetical protein